MGNVIVPVMPQFDELLNVELSHEFYRLSVEVAEGQKEIIDSTLIGGSRPPR
ncbi:MAG TPA: hypothetical protein VGP76_10670 [Planctomycetaceae bacterium]|jgi:hypothetical protein|nr:hypothetical protein [Planctomycetaceae bacterium]